MMARRKEIYEALHPETKAGVAGGKTGGRGRKIATDKMSAAIPSFADDTAAKTGKSARTVRRDVSLGEDIADDVDNIIAPFLPAPADILPNGKDSA